MSRTRSSIALLLVAVALAAGCTRNDLTAPSEHPSPSLEHQGSDN